MSAIRQTLASLEIPVNLRASTATHDRASALTPSCGESFLTQHAVDEPDAAALRRSWRRFVTAVDGICAARRRNRSNPSREAVFASAMDKACKAFNQGTETVKVNVQKEVVDTVEEEEKTSPAVVTGPTTSTPPRSAGLRWGWGWGWGSGSPPRRRRRPRTSSKHPSYVLHVSCLNAVPDELRHVAFCTADIPTPPPPPVEAQRVTESQTAALTTTTTTRDDRKNTADHATAPMVKSEIVEERVVTRTADMNSNGNVDDDDADYPPPPPPVPLVLQVLAVPDDDRDNTHGGGGGIGIRACVAVTADGTILDADRASTSTTTTTATAVAGSW